MPCSNALRVPISTNQQQIAQFLTLSFSWLVKVKFMLYQFVHKPQTKVLWNSDGINLIHYIMFTALLSSPALQFFHDPNLWYFARLFKLCISIEIISRFNEKNCMMTIIQIMQIKVSGWRNIWMGKLNNRE